jgi:hypothetical protein
MTNKTAYGIYGKPVHSIGPINITFTCACCKNQYTAPEHCIDNLYYFIKFSVGEDIKTPICKNCVSTLFSLILEKQSHKEE